MRSVLLFWCILTVIFKCGHSQFFDPNMDDNSYLEKIQDDVLQEVEDSKLELMDQAKIVQDITKVYIGAKLKENLFTALRVLAEKELDSISMQDRPRQPRQEEEDDDAPAASTRRNNIIPQVASLIKAIFGGNINLTAYVEGASVLLPKPIHNQLVGVVKLLANNPSPSTTTIKPPTTIPVVTAASVKAVEALVSTIPVPTPSPQPVKLETEKVSTRRTTTEDDEDEDEDEDETARRGRQDPLGQILNSIGSLIGGSSNRRQAAAAQAAAQAAILAAQTTESASGFEEEANKTATATNANGINNLNLDTLSQGVRNGLGDLLKIMPDIFKGAREAYKLLGTVTGLFQRLEN